MVLGFRWKRFLLFVGVGKVARMVTSHLMFHFDGFLVVIYVSYVCCTFLTCLFWVLIDQEFLWVLRVEIMDIDQRCGGFQFVLDG